MQSLKTKFLVILLLAAVFGTHANASKGNETTLGEFSIGLGYPYGSVRYGDETVAGEFKAAFGYGIELYAGRFYWHFLNTDYVRLFTGGEIGYIKLSGTYDLSGKGWEISAFAGVETFITDWISIALDFSPMYINLQSRSEGIDGVEYVVNLAVYIFPFKSARKITKQKPPQEKYETKKIITQPSTEEDKKASPKPPKYEMRQIDGIILTEDVEVE